MGTILFIAVLLFSLYAIVIEPKRVICLIDGRLQNGDMMPPNINHYELMESLKTLKWIKALREVREIASSPDGTWSIAVLCANASYRIEFRPGENGDGMVFVSVESSVASKDLEHLRQYQEANRIRCYIMERVDPNFEEQSQECYELIRRTYLMRYCAVSINVSFLCYAFILIICQEILGSDAVTSLHMLCASLAAFLCVVFVYAMPNYIVKSRSGKLLDGIPIGEYLSNEMLMEMLQERLRIKSIESIYFDETGAVTIKGRYGTYGVSVSPEIPKLFVNTKGFSRAKAHQEADYIRCSIAKLFDPAYPENPAKIYGLLKTLRNGGILAFLSVVLCVVFIAFPVLSTQYGSKGIANSYLSQYSETVTVGEAFEKFFANPKWDSYEIGRNHYVDFTGTCEFWGEPATMVITFQYFEDTFQVDNIALNGVDFSQFLWPAILQVIYSENSTSLPLPSATDDRGDSTIVREEQYDGIEGQYDDIIGSWQDSEGYGNYLFIGYNDETKQNAYAYFAMARDEFEVELYWDDGSAGGTLVIGSEPVYSVSVVKYKYWLEVSIYIVDEDRYEYIKFYPADPETCPYQNPYYVG